MTTPLNRLIKSAESHAEDVGDFNVAVGDLEVYLRTMWSLMTGEQKMAFAMNDEVREALDTAIASEEEVEDLLAALETEEGASPVDAARDLAEENGGVWGIHPDFPVEDWQTEVANEDTRVGYWAWVLSQLEQRHDEEFRSWIVEVERALGGDKHLDDDAREEFRPYFLDGLSPSEAVQEDRNAAGA